jgi:hypothetical protein
VLDEISVLERRMTMACELFIPWKPHAATLTVVEQANAIIAEYLTQGFTLTLRQLFYQSGA